jgi:transposase
VSNFRYRDKRLIGLAACGLIKASFVPDQPTQELRSLLRTRKQMTREQTSYVQRLQKTLEEAYIKLDSVISDIVGVSGRYMIEALIAGETNPVRLADLAHRRLRVPREALRDALHGRVTNHHRFLLQLHLGQYDALAVAITEIDHQVELLIERIDGPVEGDQATFRALIRLLCPIPGVSTLAALVILSEIGRDMSRFPTAGHLLACAGLCPSQDESAGKRQSIDAATAQMAVLGPRRLWRRLSGAL